MSHTSYTASERRGLLAIALIALVIIACGVGMSFCDRQNATGKPEVINHPEMVDTLDMKSGVGKNYGAGKDNGKTGKRKAKKSSSKEKKKYRKRSPNDEPVS